MPKALRDFDSGFALGRISTRLIQVPDSSASISLNSVVVDKKILLHDLFLSRVFFAYCTIILQIRAFWGKSLATKFVIMEKVYKWERGQDAR